VPIRLESSAAIDRIRRKMNPKRSSTTSAIALADHNVTRAPFDDDTRRILDHHAASPEITTATFELQPVDDAIAEDLIFQG
jgi:hypothetical protein